MAAMAATSIPYLKVVIDDDDGETSTIDPTTGHTTTVHSDGSVTVNLGDARGPHDDSDTSDFFANLALDINEFDLATMANTLCDQIDADDRSRAKHLSNIAKALDMLGMELKDPASGTGATAAPVEGMSVVTAPILLDAILRGWANAVGELLPTSGPCKIRDDGEPPKAPLAGPTMPQLYDEGGLKYERDTLAEALEKDFNHYLTVTAVEYGPETSHMLLWGTYFTGSGFKKVYRCPLRRRPVSESVEPQDLIVSDATKDLRKCTRITHQTRMAPSVMARMKFIGAYRETPETQPTPTPTAVEAKIAGLQGINPTYSRPEDQPYTLWETQCELDIADPKVPADMRNAGLQLPYLVSLDKDAKQILAIRRDWDEDDEDCTRKRMYVKFPYVPGPGFYGTGLLNLLGNASAAVTAAWREALDAGAFASFPAYAYLEIMGRQKTNDMRVGPGQGLAIQENGMMSIKDMIMGLPFHDATPGLFNIMKEITTQAQKLGGTADLPTAEGRADVPVGTMLASIEQAKQVMSAAHKGMVAAQAEELELLKELFKENPEDFWRNNDDCATEWNKEKFLQALEDCNLVPRADPNTPSHLHRLMRLITLYMMAQGQPALYDMREVNKACLEGMGWANPERFFLPEQAPGPAPPDPQMIVAQAKAQDAATNMVKAQTGSQNAVINAQGKQAEVQGKKDVATIELAKEMVIHGDTMADANRSAGLSRMDSLMEHARATREQDLDEQKHLLDVHTALNPPPGQTPGLG